MQYSCSKNTMDMWINTVLVNEIQVYIPTWLSNPGTMRMSVGCKKISLSLQSLDKKYVRTAETLRKEKKRRKLLNVKARQKLCD